MKSLKIKPMTEIDMSNLYDDETLIRYKTMLEMGSAGPGYILEDDEGPLCACGTMFLWPGVAEAWFQLINVRHTISIARTVLRLIHRDVKQYGIRRLQTTVRKCEAKHVRFVEFLGFKLETPVGLRHYFYNGDDAYIYARINGSK